MQKEVDWDEVVSIISSLDETGIADRPIQESQALLSSFLSHVQAADPSSINLLSFLFQKSLLPLLTSESLSPTLIQSILTVFQSLLAKNATLSISQMEAMQIIGLLMRQNLEKPRELFEEIGELGFSILNSLLPSAIDLRDSAFYISLSLDYANKSGRDHGIDAISFLSKLLHIANTSLRPVFPGLSVGLTAVCINGKNHHSLICLAMSTLSCIWTSTPFEEADKENLGSLVLKICALKYEHPQIRESRVLLCGSLIKKSDKYLDLSACIQIVFAGVADQTERVRSSAIPFVEQLGGSTLISAEFETCVDGLARAAKAFDEAKRLQLLQTISGIIKINKGKDNDFDSQLLTSLRPLSSALLLVSEIEHSDPKLCELAGGFILRRRPFLNSPQAIEAFNSIVQSLPSEPFVEVLIDILNDSPTKAPEIFSIFGQISQTGPRSLMVSIIEQNEWWKPKNVLTLEMVIEITSLLAEADVFQVLLYKVIESLASDYPSVRQTAMATLGRLAPNGNVSQLLASNVDYIADRLIARLQFVDVSPDVLTVFGAIVGVDGDISDLLSHLMPQILDLLDTRDSFSLPILRILPKVCEKLPSICEQIVDRSIHFILSPIQQQQCAAMDCIISALPKIETEEKQLPMVHQSWTSIIMVLKASADPASPACWRAVDYICLIVKIVRSFVKQRVGEELPTFLRILEEMVEKIRAFSGNNQASTMINSLFKLFQIGLSEDPLFRLKEVEMFEGFAKCLETDLPQFVRDGGRACIRSLFKSSPPFVWTLAIEAAGSAVKGFKPTSFLHPLPQGARLAIAMMLSANAERTV